MKRLTLIIFVGLLSFSGNWLFSVYRGIPVPRIQDEFSYLLAADTFAHGRVTNPTHPMWEHFETFQVLQQPTYMSKYPPAQGFFMAVGQVLWGHPIYGVWLSASLMCMSICWMLYAWIPSYWAFMGGVVSVLEFGMFTYWSQSYWGGAVAAFGGALVFGALPRIFQYQRIRDVLWLGLGIAVLINSRPVDGILIGIPVGCLVLPWKIKWDKIKSFHFMKKVVLPFILILVVTVIGTGAYNKAVTGKASLFPYALYLKSQMAVPLFIWEPLKPIPTFKNQVIGNFENGFENKYYLLKRTWKGFFADVTTDIYKMFRFYFGYILAIPVLFFLPRVLRNRKRTFKLLLVILILVCTSAGMVAKAQTHYFSTLTSLVVLLAVLGLRTLVGLFKQTGLKMVYVLIAVQLLINMLVDVRVPGNLLSYGVPLQGQGIALKSYTREQFINVLMQKGGQHLVLVNDEPNHIFHNEWVYNGADIDKEQIVWARSMDEKDNAKLLAYFKDRQAWRITVNREEYQYKKYYQR